MSAIADFRIIEASKLTELNSHSELQVKKSLFGKKTIDTYWDYLNANSRKLKDFQWSGHIFANLLIFLEEKKGIDLLTSEYDELANAIAGRRQASIIILTFDQKQKFLKKLSSNAFNLEELIEFNKEFSEDDDPDLAKAEMEGISALHDSLSQLTNDESVILLNIH